MAQNPKIKKFRLGELFCGPGGLALGALGAEVCKKSVKYQIKHAWANDYEANSCETYRKNICPDAPDTVICEDVRNLRLDELSDIDGFAYGFPCNDFSLVGEQKGFHGNFGPLYTYGVEIINRFNPLFFVAENVSGITSANNGGAFSKILHDLENAGSNGGYNLTVNLYKAEEYGVPQRRHRMIIVGFARHSGLFYRVPKPTSKGNPRTVREALENPPIAPNASNNEITRQSQIVIDRLKHTRPGENAWNALLPSHLKLNVKSTHLSHIYKRLDPSKPSYTITGSGGGGTHGYHWSEPRALTNRERARIQTFPDWYDFQGSKESVRKQIGMAVPPLLSSVIFTAILKTIAKEDYPFVQPTWSKEYDLFVKG